MFQGNISILSSVLRGFKSSDTNMLRRVEYSSLNRRNPFKWESLANVVDFTSMDIS